MMNVKGVGETMITESRWKILRRVGSFSQYQHELGVSPARSNDPPSHSPAESAIKFASHSESLGGDS